MRKLTPKQKAHKKAYNKRWHSIKENRNRLSVRLSKVKDYARSIGKTWSLSKEEYAALIVLPCNYCQNKLGPPCTRGVGLDRLDNSKGYEPGNVVSCCTVCNIMRNDNLTPQETLVAAQAVVAYRESLQAGAQGELSSHEQSRPP